MAETASISAWIALFLGFYAIAAAVGELRSPNSWWMMLKELERSPALRFVIGFLSLALGVTIYLVNPWRAGDWLSIGISALGGLHVAQGLLILTSGQRFLRIARALVGRAGPAWAGFAALAGVALVFIALSRLQVV